MINKSNLNLLMGPLLFLFCFLVGDLKGLSGEGKIVLGTMLWMAAWWTSEAVPIAITALLPIIVFPLTGVMTIKVTGASYAHPIIFLFIGGFMLAASIEKWNLHTRVALTIILKLGSNPKSIILGFMIATAFLSMWLSNTATTLMMLPIGIAVINQLSDIESQSTQEFSKPLLLGIAYSASIGGISTLIGTPTNVIFSGVMFERYGYDISFAQWMLFATPIAIALLFLCWFYLVNIAFKVSSENNSKNLNAITNYKNLLGNITYEEKCVLAIFSFVSFCWITRSFLLNQFIPNLSDPIIALIGAFLLFIIPTKGNKTKAQRETLLDWNTAVKIPWGIILLFGGGLSLAKAFNLSGLSVWFGLKISLLGMLPLFILLLVLIALVNFMTEITSNMSTVSMMLPVLASLSNTLGINPLILMIGATCAASCAFMLPVATAPNAIIFGAGYLHIKDMIKAGVALNIVSIIAFTLYVYFIMPIIFKSVS